MPGKKPRGEKLVLSRQEISNRKRGLQEKKRDTEKPGRRIVLGLFLAAAGLFCLVALASFEPRQGNAAGPVGYALADALNGAVGVGAYVLPALALYLAGILWVGQRDKRRWPQWVGLAAWIASGLVLLHLVSTPIKNARPLAGELGMAMAESLRALFSTVGTVIIVVAVAMAAAVVATEKAALRVAATAGLAVKHGALAFWALALTAGVEGRKRLAAHREASAKEKLERAAFLAQLEADEEELNDAERAAQEADAMADEAYRLSKEAEARAQTQARADLETPKKREKKPALPTVEANAETMAEVPRSALSKLAVVGTPPVTAPPVATLPVAVPTPAPAPAARMPVIVEPKAIPKPSRAAKETASFEFVGGHTKFTLPPLSVLEGENERHTQLDKDAFLTTAERLRAKLQDFGITGEVVEIRPGPVVTMYEFLPGAGIKVSKIASLADDLAMAMEAMRVRIVAPIPGKGVVGIEVPNRDRETVYLKEIAEQDAFAKSSSKLTMCVGKDIEGMPYALDLAKAPHLLIAGTTGSGKSVAVNAMIMSLLLKATPEEVRFIMVDPKRLELSVYEGIPHLLLPVVTDPKKAALALRWAVEEMERRYQLLAEAGVRNISGYNKLVESVGGDADAMAAKKRPAVKPTLIVDVAPDESEEAALQRAQAMPPLGVAAPQSAEDVRTPLDGITPEVEPALPDVVPAKKELQKLPYIVVIIDELADLMMVASREVEMYIARLAQMARAAGIHLMVATQRPSTDVVTGVIKANFPTRISFMLRTKPDSMTILGTVGAESLLGMGDMLIMPPTSAHLQRVHGAYVSEQEIKRAVDHLKAQGKPVYDDSILKPREDETEGGEEGDDLSDELWDQALATVSQMENVSISMLQRKMRIGYNRAARMIERMERDGIVGPADGAKPRQVLLRPVGEMPGAGAP